MKAEGTPGRVVVVGGGAAGMVAAIAAARSGAAVTILERLPRVGKKLLATGNGRCNFANAHPGLERYHGARAGFPAAVLDRFGLPETLAFFRGLGVEPREEEGGKLFPRSGQASAVLDVLRHELERLGVETRCGVRATRLRRRRRGGWEVATPGDTLAAAALVLAAGGRAAPQLGSDGSGHELLRELGHRLVPPFPALTRIRVRSPWLRHVKGVKIDARVRLEAAGGGPPLAEAAGEVLFTETGLSGPPVLDVSRTVGELGARGASCVAAVDLAPEIGRARLEELLDGRFANARGGSAEFALVGFLPKRLIAPLLREAGVADPGGDAAGLPAGTARAVAGVIAGWRLPVTGTGSWTEAQVTAGGVDTGEVDPATLASRLAPGIFVAGEILDVDGDCGGFNLQWAWSSGHVAGEEAAVLAGAGVRR